MQTLECGPVGEQPSITPPRQWSVAALIAICMAIAVAIGFNMATAMAQPSGRSAIQDDHVTYVFKPNDTLIGLAQRYFIRLGDYQLVQQLNNIDEPTQIPIGTQINIPRRILKTRPAKAVIAAYRGQVSIDMGDRKNVTPRKGVALSAASQITTGAASSLSLSLDDGSFITMPSNTKVRITRMHVILLTGSVDYEFALDKGGVRSKVTPFRNPQDRYNIRTPVAVSAVRGTDFRNRYDPDNGEMLAELIEGGLELERDDIAGDPANDPNGQAVQPSAANTLLQPAFGAIITPLATRTEQLLAPPVLIGRFSEQSSKATRFSIAKDDAAIGYRLQIANDSSFVDILADIDAVEPAFLLADLPSGHYFGKVTAFANSGLEGMPQQFAFAQQARRSPANPSKGFVFRWSPQTLSSGKDRYRFQLYAAPVSAADDGQPDSKDPAAFAIPIVDEAALGEPSIILSDLASGDYYWRIGTTTFQNGSAAESWSGFNQFQVAR